ncbi:hypothetical protein HPO_00475 [Hyphomonas polymorpha PS728]|uniref:DUF423 domain-containing protein n=1 Tax=Hyphomonas polymorpha PS728 TaxID=1280954 RepID=A0A062VNW5_9PROT|nr:MULTISPECIES: DUF423 domain-containing protein [Hyphomonas]AXE63240.1 hypothetical protein BBF93_02680 [Hyphomonas sp. CACIAM 19H1]KDA00458.1 hypothetical protein HPO_00475 [Hyphomonas polymorpha PS728]
MNRLIPAAALVGFLSVALGAFGAHALDGRLTAQGAEWWHTATLYGLTHAGAALAAGLSGRGGKIAAGGWMIVAGAVIFAGTLYAMALDAPRWLGAVTPVGGISLLAGWVMIGLGGLSAARTAQDVVP